MRCAKCRTILRDHEEGGHYRIVCETCGKTKKSCRICKDQEVDKCFKCQLKNATNKLDFLFSDKNHGSYLEKCRGSKDWGYGGGENKEERFCNDLVADVKLSLVECVREKLKSFPPDELLKLLFQYHLNEGAAIFWLPITMTGTFYKTGFIPPMNGCILFSNELEKHFGVGKDYRAQTTDGTADKEEWLVGTFKMLEKNVTGQPTGIGQIKSVLTTCKILHFFVIERQSFPNVQINSLLLRAEVLVKLLKNKDNAHLRDYVEPVELYLANVKNQMNQGANQPTANNSSTGGNSNNE